MQRQIYPVLLLLAVALAVAVCFRPSVADDLMTMAQTWGDSVRWPSELLGRARTGFGSTSIPGPPLRPIPVSQPVPFPATPAAPGTGAAGSALDSGPAYPSPAAGFRQGRLRALPPDRSAARSAVAQSPPFAPGRPAPDPRRERRLPGVAAGPSYLSENSNFQGPSRRPPRQPPPATLCQGAEILARVGSNVVLGCELNAAVNEILGQNKDRIPPGQMETQRKLLTKQLLKQEVEFKLIYQDAQRTIPKENLDKIRKRLGEQFEKVVVPERMKASGAGSRRQWEQTLRQLGSSVEEQRRTFIERALAKQWVREQIKSDEEVSHQEMLDYYQAHLADFEHPARARWQQLMVRKSSYPAKAQAFAALATWGNQVLGGAPFEEVAKAHSEGVTASDGGVRDWTTKGALVSEVLDEAIFGLPVGALSRILEDEQGFHIIRVLQREEATVTPFLEAQVEIKQKLAELGRKDQVQQYLARLQKQIPVWTVFDEEDAHQQASAGSRSWVQ